MRIKPPLDVVKLQKQPRHGWHAMQLTGLGGSGAHDSMLNAHEARVVIRARRSKPPGVVCKYGRTGNRQ